MAEGTAQTAAQTWWRFGLPTGENATPKNFYEYGISLYQYGQYDMALVCFERAIELSPDLIEAYEMRGTTLAMLGKSSEGLRDLSFVIEQRPNSGHGYNSRGLVYRDLNQCAEAIADFSKAIEINPDYGCSYYNRALVYYQLGQVDDALGDLQHCLGLEPYRTSSLSLDVQKVIDKLQLLKNSPPQPTPSVPPVAPTPEPKKGAFAQLRRWFTR